MTKTRSQGVPVREVMSRCPKTLGRNDQLWLADDVMRAAETHGEGA